MQTEQLMMGGAYLTFPTGEVTGGFVTIEDERYYRISKVDLMPDFFMSIVSDSNHWMFLSSNGALTAGRQDRDNALFPYYTEDKIHDCHGLTGSKTVILCEGDGSVSLWEPFAKSLSGLYATERNLYKSVYGNKVIFEEINHDLQLSFRYGWYNSVQFGFVKRSWLSVLGDHNCNLRILDGLRNILPSEVECDFQSAYSNLLDGYKKHELLEPSQLGLFTLSAIPIDKAEPSESLRATTVWSLGLDTSAVLLSDQQLESFRRAQAVHTELDVKGGRGSYFLVADLTLDAGEGREWMTVAEINQTSGDVNDLSQWLAGSTGQREAVLLDVEAGTRRLRGIVANADGLQATAQELTAARHFSNTLFNVMRGGVYLDGYRIASADFRAFVRLSNRHVYERCAALLRELDETSSSSELNALCARSGDADLVRIGLEYLPLTFSRRHGDPSRPWNRFSIITHNDDGTPVSDYQGNWRDIFQNWEALSLSFPEFVENIICKFLNASTADGYNPYRITRAGIDWEQPEPDDPWAYIGYWGDHQIIYLQKLLELSARFHPAKLRDLLTRDIFAYANVPYRIRAYSDIVIDPKNTIDFEHALNAQIDKQVEQVGTDGRLMQSTPGRIYHVNMAEKILVAGLVKLSNFVPEGGIWMNTQRPEWNDANNALVGNGLSMVTLCYLRRYLAFWEAQWEALAADDLRISVEVADFFDTLREIFAQHEPLLAARFDDAARRRVTDELGHAGSDYRHRIYMHAFSGEKRRLSAPEIAEFFALAVRFMDHSIAANQRDDGLYHAYNLIAFKRDGVTIRHLYEMLEGQVAILSTGHLSPADSLRVLDAMKSSPLFREDQYSYMLYPDRELPRFTEKNRVPDSAVTSSGLLQRLLDDESQQIISRDNSGVFHFSSDFHNADHLAQALDTLPGEIYGDLIAEERSRVLAVYEAMFDHQSFTGRSGTFYAYEGLGCIYWHMVSKLLLAVGESYARARDGGADSELLGRLKDHYYEIKAGIGLFKAPALYGAFPTDAYSHSARDAGVKQPGMTGQVKEDILSRFGELGVQIDGGALAFDPGLINQDEFFTAPGAFEFVDLAGELQSIELSAAQMAFSICQVPVIYTRSERQGITLSLASGERRELAAVQLDARSSQSIFQRLGEIQRIDVRVTI